MPKLSSDKGFTYIIGTVALIVVAGLSFLAGVSYQKSQTTTMPSTVTTNQMPGQNGFGGGFGTRRRGSIGQVTAVSASSITVKASDGTSSTYDITSSTQITNNGQTVTADSIKVGDNVLIRRGTSNQNEAASIVVNPTLPQGGTAPSGSPAPDNTMTQ